MCTFHLPGGTACTRVTTEYEQYEQIVSDSAVAGLQDVIHDKEEIISDLSRKCETVTGNLTERREKVKEMRKEAKNLKRQYSTVCSNLEKSEETCNKLKVDTCSSVSGVQEENKKLKKNVIQLEQKNVVFKAQVQEHLELNSKLTSNNDELLHFVKDALQAEKNERDLETSLHYYETLLNDAAASDADVQIFDNDTGKYTPALTQCVMELTNCNVSSHNVPKVIESVLKMIGKRANRLPVRSTVENISRCKLVVAQKQISDVVPQAMDTTIYADETRKRDSTYNAFLVTDEHKNPYLLGIREMANKSGATTLETLNEILRDLTSIEGTGTDTGSKILFSIRNFMSDRAKTNCTFATLLETYREKVYPQVKDNLDNMSLNEQKVCIKLNHFLCGLHLLVNFAEISAQMLHKFDSMTFGEQSESDAEPGYVLKFPSESVIMATLRIASKCFSSGVDEKSGCAGSFRLFCEQSGVPGGFLAFRGNRFNVVFLMAEIVYYHKDRIITYFEEQGCSNNLHKAMFASIKKPYVQAGLKVLGLLAKLVFSPLWRTIESNKHIFEMNDVHVYRDLLKYFSNNSDNSNGFL